MPLQLKKGDDEFTSLNQVDRSQATSSYVQSIANIMPLNEYRMGTVKEWENTVKEILIAEGQVEKASLVNFNSASTGITNPRLAKEMEHSRDYLSRVMSVPSIEETKTAGLMTRLADKMYGVPVLGGKPRDWVKSGIGIDPVTKLKGLTFNLHLGFFNVRQLFVQGQNAVVAMSVSPQHAPAAFLGALAMRGALFSDDPKVWRKMAELNPTLNADDFVKDMQDFKDSGLIDGIIRQADHDASAVGVGNASMQAFRKVAQAGQVFFTEGETMARLMAWGIAKRKLPKGASIREISHEVTRLSMNMASANAATWQTNLLGVPTQFLQVQAKFLENTVGGLMTKGGGVGKTGWTRAEAAKILAGQMALYGAVGVPVIEDAASYAGELLGMTAQEFGDKHPLVLEGIDEGAFGILTKTMGFENNFSKSGNLLASALHIHEEGILFDAFMGMSDLFIDNSADVDMASLLGVQSSTLKKVGNVGATMSRNMKLLWQTPSLDNLGQAAVENLDAIVSMTSTWSNAKKGLLIHNMGLRSKTTGATYYEADELSEMSWQTLAAKSLGFELDIETTLWERKKYVWDYDKEQKGLKTDWTLAHQRFLIHGSMDRLMTERQLILSMINNPEQEVKFLGQMADAMVAQQSTNGKAQRKYVETVFANGWKVTPRHAINEE
jgi:hypothetical protein